MTPEIARAAGELANRVVVVKLNAVTETQALTPFNLAAVPVLILFSKDGQERARTMKTLLAHQIVKRSEEHTSELQSLMRISYAVFCLKKKNKQESEQTTTTIL